MSVWNKARFFCSVLKPRLKYTFLKAVAAEADLAESVEGQSHTSSTFSLSSDEVFEPECFCSDDFKTSPTIDSKSFPGTSSQSVCSCLEHVTPNVSAQQARTKEQKNDLSANLKRLALKEAGRLSWSTFIQKGDIGGCRKFVSREYRLKTEQKGTDDAQVVNLENLFEISDKEAKILAEKRTNTEEAYLDYMETVKNNIFLVANAGFGKTWTSKQLVKLAINGEMGFDAKYVFFIQCGNIDLESSSTLPVFIATESGLKTEFLGQIIHLEERDDILFVLDGLDEINISRLMQENGKRAKRNLSTQKSGYAHLHSIFVRGVFRKAKKVWTCNYQTWQDLKKQTSGIVFDILPLSDDKQQEHQESRFCRDESKKSKARSIFENHQFLRDLCRSPFYADLFYSTLNKDFEPNQCSVSNLLCMGLQCHVNRLHDIGESLEVVYRDQLPRICEIAWKNFLLFKFVFEIDESLQRLNERVKERFLEPAKSAGVVKRYKFPHRLRQVFLASVHAMTSLDFKEFKNVVNAKSLADDRWATMAMCLFGMCDVTKQELSEYVHRQVQKVDTKKIDHLVEVAQTVVREATYAEGCGERIQPLFHVGRWMLEAKCESVLTCVSEYLPNHVVLTEKIFSRDVGALCHLARHRRMDLSIGFRCSPHFRNDALFLLFASVAMEDKLKIRFVDLRGREINLRVGKEIAKCISKVRSLNLGGAKVDEETLIYIVDSIAALDRVNTTCCDRGHKLQLGSSDMKMGERLLRAIARSVVNLSELTLIADNVSYPGLLFLVQNISMLTFKLDLLDLGVPFLDEELSHELGKSSDKFHSLRLRGCEVTENSIPVLTEQILQQEEEMRGLYLDHVKVTERDVKAIGQCLHKFKSWLVIMYCDVTKEGFEYLKVKHVALGQDNYLQIFLGDVEGVGESVTLQRS